MTAKDKVLFHSRGSSRHFLLSRTDTERLKDVRRKKIDVAHRALRSAYPDMLYDKKFMDHALQALEAVNRFSALVIRLDQNDQDNKGGEFFPALC